MLQNIHKPIIPQLNYSLIEKKHTSNLKSNVEHKSQPLVNKISIILEQNNNEQQNIYAKNFQQPNFNMISPEDCDPLAVTFIEPKNQLSRIISPLTANPEPKSLDLTPVNDTFDAFDDEFSDFQYAQFTITDYSKKDHEFTDFQSAFDTLSFKENTLNSKSIEDDVDVLNVSPIALNVFETQKNSINYKNDIHDKYEVFRTLAAENVDIDNSTSLNNNNNFLDSKPIESIVEKVQNSDVYDDEFGDFLCVEEVSSNKSEIELNEKNIQVCIIYLN